MRSLTARLLPALLTTTALAGGAALLAGGQTMVTRPSAARAIASRPGLARSYGKLPLAFEANGGRTDKRVDFLARGAGYSLFLTPSESVLAVRHGHRGAVLRTRLLDAASSRGVPEAKLPGKVNSLIGDDPSRWRTGISTYQRVRYHSVYPGIDLLYHGRSGRLEYDFEVAPGGDPSRIGLALVGARKLRLDGRGDLVIATGAGTLRQPRPVAYQGTGAERSRVSARYVLNGGRVRVQLGRYDRSRALTIDPILAYSTFLGGGATDKATAIAVDADKNAYVAGQTSSTDFPLSASPNNNSEVGGDAFVTKLDPSGTSIVYSTYIGGGGSDQINAIALDSSNDVDIAGETTSSDFPTLHGRDKTYGGSTDGFAAELSATGSAIYWGTYLGGAGSDHANGISVASDGDAWVAGDTASSDIFTSGELTGGFQTTGGGGTDAFVVRLDYSIFRELCLRLPCTTSPALAADYATYLGGSSSDVANAIALDDSDAAYITGTTSSTNWPVRTGLGDATGTDALVAKLVSNASTADGSLIYSGYLGGSGTDAGNGIGVTGNGLAQIVGDTDSSDLPGSPGSEPAPLARGSFTDGFVSSVSSTGNSYNHTAYLGGNGNDHANAITVTDKTFMFCLPGSGCFTLTTVSQYIVGDEKSSDFPGVGAGGLADPANGSTNSSPLSASDEQAFALKRIPSATTPLIWSMFLGGNSTTADIANGIAVDSKGKAYFAGQGGFNLPTTTGSFQPASGGGTDGFAARLDQRPPTIDSGPAEGEVVTSNSVEFTFSTPDPGMSYYCSGLTGDGHLDNTSTAGCSPPKSYTGLAEGPQTFGVATVDGGGAQSDQTNRSFIVDTQPPSSFDLVAPDDGATVSTLPTFQWKAATDTGSGLSYEILIDDQKNTDVPASACGGDGMCSAQPATPIPTGTHTWAIRALDEAGHSTDSSTTRTINVVDPPQARFTATPNPALTGRTVTFDGSTSNDATHHIAKFEWDLDGDGNFETDTAENSKATKSYDKAGTVKVSLRVTDASGVTATSSVDLKVLSLTTPSGLLGVTINDGAQYTRTPDVTVTTIFPTGTTSMVFSNDGGFLKPQTFSPEKTTAWKLDSSGPERLPKTIYVRYFIGPLPTETFQDDIILDETPPKVEQAAVTPAAPGLVNAGSAAHAAKAKLAKWKVKVKATDSNSGVASVQVTSNKKKPGKAIKYKTKLTVKSAKRPKWIRARDRAGNYSKWRKAR